MATQARGDATIRAYDHLAPRYDRQHRTWLRYAGGEAQSALEAATRAILRPGMTLLDAGSGTGTFARGLIAGTRMPIAMTLLDPSLAMLAHCANVRAERVVGRLEALPFPDEAFDIVTCAWALETTTAPKHGVAELRRVTRAGGVVCLAFCANQPAGSLAGWMMRQAVTARGTGRFLAPTEVEDALIREGDFDTTWLPCRGPVAALLARKRGTSGRRWDQAA